MLSQFVRCNVGIKESITTCHRVNSFSMKVDVTMSQFTEEQSHSATGRLQACANQGDVAQHMGISRATVNSFCARYDTGSTLDRAHSNRPRATSPVWDKTDFLPNRYQSSKSGRSSSKATCAT